MTFPDERNQQEVGCVLHAHSVVADPGRQVAAEVALGYVQATLTVEDTDLVADIAWVITPSAQHRGIATEAATAMIVCLQEHRVSVVRAFIHPDHHASERVAQHLGLTPTSATVDGEVLWALAESDAQRH